VQVAGMNFVSFTTQIYNARNWQGTAKDNFLTCWGMAPLAPLIRLWTSLKMVGVTMTNRMSARKHVGYVSRCAQSTW